MANLANAARLAALDAPAAAIHGCPGQRRLRLQPHAFHEGDPADHSGTSWDAQLKEARAIWGGCCIDLVADPIQLHEIPELRRSDDVSTIRALALGPRQQADRIDVFLVDSDLAGDGGGASFSPTTALARVIMSNQNAGNPFLLAHEIGHVLGGLHPGIPGHDGLWAGDNESILVPSGSNQTHNPFPKNTPRNCRQAKNDALIQTGAGCCISVPG